MRPEDFQLPQYGTGIHYPSCLGSCTGCMPPAPFTEDGDPVASPFHQPEPVAQPTPPRDPVPRGMDPTKWAGMNRAARRAYKKGSRR